MTTTVKMILLRQKNAILFDDPVEVLIEQAKLVEIYRAVIARAAHDILTKFPNQKVAAVAARSYVAKFANAVRDQSTRAALKTAAIIAFAQRGVT